MKNQYPKMKMCSLGRILWTFGVAAMLGGTTASVHADNSWSGDITSSITLTESCFVHEKGPRQLGAMMNFGSLPSNFTGTVDSKSSTKGGDGAALELECDPEVSAVSISINRGDNLGKGLGIGDGKRAMKEGDSSYLSYQVFTSPERTTKFPADGVMGVPIPADGKTIELPIFGRITKTKTGTLPSGVYRDVMQVIVGW